MLQLYLPLCRFYSWTSLPSFCKAKKGTTQYTFKSSLRGTSSERRACLVPSATSPRLSLDAWVPLVTEVAVLRRENPICPCLRLFQRETAANSPTRHEKSSIKSSSAHSLDPRHKRHSLSPTKLLASTEPRAEQEQHTSHVTPPSPVNQQRHISPSANVSLSLGGRRSKLPVILSPVQTESRVVSGITTDKPRDHGVSMTPSTTSTLTIDDDSLCSSRSSPSLLVPSDDRTSPVQSSSHCQTGQWSSECDLRRLERCLPSKKEREVLDIYLLTPNTDFYHHLCAAWHDQKIVSFPIHNNVYTLTRYFWYRQ